MLSLFLRVLTAVLFIPYCGMFVFACFGCCSIYSILCYVCFCVFWLLFYLFHIMLCFLRVLAAGLFIPYCVMFVFSCFGCCSIYFILCYVCFACFDCCSFYSILCYVCFCVF